MATPLRSSGGEPGGEEGHQRQVDPRSRRLRAAPRPSPGPDSPSDGPAHGEASAPVSSPDGEDGQRDGVAFAANHRARSGTAASDSRSAPPWYSDDDGQRAEGDGGDLAEADAEERREQRVEAGRGVARPASAENAAVTSEDCGQCRRRATAGCGS